MNTTHTSRMAGLFGGAATHYATVQSKEFLAIRPAHVSLATGEQACNSRLFDANLGGDLCLGVPRRKHFRNDVFPVHSAIISDFLSYNNRQNYVIYYQNADMTTFGERLKDARKAAGLSQKEVARRIGTKQPLISELESDEYQTSGFTTKLAYLYKVSARWLAEGKGPREISASELLDEPEMEWLVRQYGKADAVTKALVTHLLREPEQARPAWMSEGTASSIENARLLVAEQFDGGK